MIRSVLYLSFCLVAAIIRPLSFPRLSQVTPAHIQATQKGGLGFGGVRRAGGFRVSGNFRDWFPHTCATCRIGL